MRTAPAFRSSVAPSLMNKAPEAGLLAAFGSQLVTHGRELRAYELLALLSILFARLVLAEVDAPSRRHEVALVAVVAAGGLTHYFFVFSVLAVLGWLWLDPAVRAARRRASAAILLGGAAAAPWTPAWLQQYHQHRFWWIGAFRLRTVLAVPVVTVYMIYDVGARSDIYNQVRAAVHDGAAAIIVSSDFDELLLLADRILVLAAGRVVASAASASIDRHWLAQRMYAIPGKVAV